MGRAMTYTGQLPVPAGRSPNEAFEAAMAALDRRIGRWSRPEVFVLADSSFCTQHEVKQADIDLREVLGVPRWQAYCGSGRHSASRSTTSRQARCACCRW